MALPPSTRVAELLDLVEPILDVFLSFPAPERYAALKVASLVCSLWRHPAQSRLIAHLDTSWVDEEVFSEGDPELRLALRRGIQSIVCSGRVAHGGLLLGNCKCRVTARILTEYACTPTHLSFCSEATFFRPAYHLTSLAIRSVSFDSIAILAPLTDLKRLDLNICNRATSLFGRSVFRAALPSWKLRDLKVTFTGFGYGDRNEAEFPSPDAIWAFLLPPAYDTLRQFSIVGISSSFWEPALRFLGPCVTALQFGSLPDGIARTIYADRFPELYPSLPTLASAPLMQPDELAPFAEEMHATLSRLPDLRSLVVDIMLPTQLASEEWRRLAAKCDRQGVVLRTRRASGAHVSLGRVIIL